VNEFSDGESAEIPDALVELVTQSEDAEPA
jgi:hypothetical protein